MELSSGTLIFVAATQETPLDHLAYAHSPTGLYIFTYFESCCLRVWLPVGLNPIKPPLGQWRSWHPLNYWEPLTVTQAAWTITEVRETTRARARMNKKKRFTSKTRSLPQNRDSWLFYLETNTESQGNWRNGNMSQTKEQDGTSERKIKEKRGLDGIISFCPLNHSCPQLNIFHVHSFICLGGGQCSLTKMWTPRGPGLVIFVFTCCLEEYLIMAST